MHPTSQNTIALVLSQRAPPRLHVLATGLEDTIELEGQRFKESGLGDWQGFYDWLRTESGRVIGVRQWLDNSNAHINALEECQNVVLAAHRSSLQVFLAEEREFHPESSNDQDFGNNRLFVGEHGFALTFFEPAESFSAA